MNKQPTIPQMLSRSNSGHRSALQRLSEGSDVMGTERSAGALRGMRTVMLTLSRWGCAEAGQITERGRELLAAMIAKEDRTEPISFRPFAVLSNDKKW